jgi:hypothetical protein
MPARNGGINSTFEVQLGLGTTFGLATALVHRPAAPPEPPPATPPEPSEPPEIDDRDRDGDGIPDRLDACPDEPRTASSVIGDDGCPEPDPDGDGIIGDADRCPDQAEDFDGFEDADGCPDPDNDHDGIEDRRDVCPGEPETVNGFEDDDGCPDQLPAEITRALATAVRFERGRARVTRNAAAALRPVLAMLDQPAGAAARDRRAPRAPRRRRSREAPRRGGEVVPRRSRRHRGSPGDQRRRGLPCPADRVPARPGPQVAPRRPPNLAC